MSALSSILRSAEGGRLTFWCPGCKEPHAIKHGNGGWTWNGNADKPTFTPSILVSGIQTEKDDAGKWTGEWVLDAQGNTIPTICHSFVTDGRIQFLGDCTHEMVGQTVDLPPCN